MSFLPSPRSALFLLVAGTTAAAVALAMLVSGYAGAEDPANDVPFVLLLLVWGVLGTLLVFKVPASPIGWLLLLMSVVTEVTFLAQMYAGSDGPGHVYAAWFDSWAADWVPPLIVVLLLLLFPSGQLTDPFERVIARSMIAVASLAAFATAFVPGQFPRHDVNNPFGIEALDGVLSAIVAISGPAMTLVFLLAIIAMFWKLRRSSGVEKQQLKWFFLAAALLVFDLLVAIVAGALGVDTAAGDMVGATLFFIGLAGLAGGITIAILRYRLYEIDVLINRALVYATLTALVALSYVVLVVVLQFALDPITKDSDLAVAASTLAAAALFRPLRTRIQGFVDRRFYRRKYDAARTLEQMGLRLRDHVTIEAVENDVLATVRDTVQPIHSSLWVISR